MRGERLRCSWGSFVVANDSRIIFLLILVRASSIFQRISSREKISSSNPTPKVRVQPWSWLIKGQNIWICYQLHTNIISSFAFNLWSAAGQLCFFFISHVQPIPSTAWVSINKSTCNLWASTPKINTLRIKTRTSNDITRNTSCCFEVFQIHPVDPFLNRINSVRNARGSNEWTQSTWNLESRTIKSFRVCLDAPKAQMIHQIRLKWSVVPKVQPHKLGHVSMEWFRMNVQFKSLQESTARYHSWSLSLLDPSAVISLRHGLGGSGTL